MPNTLSEFSSCFSPKHICPYTIRLRNAWRSPVNQTIEGAELQKKQKQVHAYLTNYRAPLALVGLHAIVVGPQ